MGYNFFRDRCNQYWTNLIGHAGNSFCGKFSVKRKSCLSEHSMPCALEITNNGRFKQAYGILLLNHYLHCHNTYGHQTWQDGDLTWGALNHSHLTLWSLIFWDHTINKKHVSTTAIPMSTKLDMMITYLEWLLVIKWSDPLTCGFLKSCDKLKPYLLYHSVYNHKNWQNGDILKGS